jgi:hypothetical protein
MTPEEKLSSAAYAREVIARIERNEELRRGAIRHGRLTDYASHGRTAVLRFRDALGREDIALGDRLRIVSLVRAVAGDERAIGLRCVYGVTADKWLVSLDRADTLPLVEEGTE